MSDFFHIFFSSSLGDIVMHSQMVQNKAHTKSRKLSPQKIKTNPYLSRVMRKPTFSLCENKDADQLRGNREADQRLCFRYIDSPIPLLSKSEISSLKPSSVTAYSLVCVGPGRKPECWFSHDAAHFCQSNYNGIIIMIMSLVGDCK